LGGGHIPGAVNAPWNSWTDARGKKQGEKGWNTTKELSDIEKHIQSLGIDGTKPVVIYGDPKALGRDGRVAIELVAAGVRNVSILNGGIESWTKAGGEITKEAPNITPSSFKADPSAAANLVIDTDTLAANLKEYKILDARSEPEYKGEKSDGSPRPGHIAGALFLSLNDLYDADGTVKSLEAITALMESKGIAKEDKIVTYCTIGNRGGTEAVILRSAGYTALSYAASFSEWSGQENLPVEK
jgi:thiosulfate/3-mercaptopyruvate sulfurtransferase